MDQTDQNEAKTVSRFISPEGILVGVTFTPLMLGEKEIVQTSVT